MRGIRKLFSRHDKCVYKDYFNCKRYYSINLQGIVNSQMKFIHASVGYPGSIHDARVLRISGIYDQAEKGQILTQPKRRIQSDYIGPLLAGDSAYPATSWILKPYSFVGNLPREKRKFNKRFSGMRSLVERAFGMLKSWWRILLKQNDQTLESVVRCVMACVVLYNFCITVNDPFELEDEIPNDNSNETNNIENIDNVDIRESIYQYMSNIGYL